MCYFTYILTLRSCNAQENSLQENRFTTAIVFRNYVLYNLLDWARRSLVVKALGYEPEGRGFEIR
jgi:hypothetical protein